MDQASFNDLISEISANFRRLERSGIPITPDLINKKVDQLIDEVRGDPNFDVDEMEVIRLKFLIGNNFNVQVDEAAISLHNPDLPRWFVSKKHEIVWKHWDAYQSMLESQGRSKEVLDANEAVIDDILDYSGDPRTLGNWSRKGLVMGNVQSGKTQNYIGLINKAIDAGYKTIILLGGHLNDLRKQTQERVDEGVLGRESRHLAEAKTTAPVPIGVGLYGENSINTGTTTKGDFNKVFADRFGFKLNGETVVIFTIKKHTGAMQRLYDWIKDYHYLEPSGGGKKLDGPLLLIDDEADYASINTKHHKEEVTKTNDAIRKLLSLFKRNTYIGYTATPFANIFIDPDDNDYSVEDDLFPSDFMIKIPVPSDYHGQDFFFSQELADAEEGSEDELNRLSPTIPISDYEGIYQLKKDQAIEGLPLSLKQAIRVFNLVIAIRSLRGEQFAHNTMLVNISHLTVHQNRLEFLIESYQKEISEALEAYADLGVGEARRAPVLQSLEKTFHGVFSGPENYMDVFGWLKKSSGKVKVWAVNQSQTSADGRELNYSIHKEHGLCAIVIGGHKLSRGLTLEGLSISYFARNSKAYDTLMQMCRWFGYRPNYDDLCRVYLPQESINWYTFISSAIRELYWELDLMSKREQRPSDFGLKVREHPGAMMITAKNKVGWAESQTRSQDLWGQVQRRFKFRSAVDTNRRNLEYTKKFIQCLMDRNENRGSLVWGEKTGSITFSGAEYSDLIDYVENMDLPEDDLGNKALVRHLRKMEEAGLAMPKVTLFNQMNSRSTKWEKSSGLSQDDRVFINKEYPFLPNLNVRLAKRRMFKDSENNFRVKSVHLGNPDDEKLFLLEREVQEIKDVQQKNGRSPVSFDYLGADARDYPGLLIYLFAVAVGPEQKSKDQSLDLVELGHGQVPTVGFSVSFPRPDNLKGKTSKEISEVIKSTKYEYQVGKVYSRNQELSYYEDIEYDE